MTRADYSVRALVDADLPWFLTVRNASSNSLHDSRRFSLEDAASWFQDSNPDLRVIEFGGRPVGYFRVGPVEEREGLRLLWIGCDIAPGERRRGHAEASYRIFSPILMQEYRADGLILRVLPANAAAMALYRKLGFTPSSFSAQLDEDGRALNLTDIEMSLVEGGSGPGGAADTLDLLLDSGAFH